MLDGDRLEDDPRVRTAWKGLLGRLINKGARLRFFPHRVAMFLLLALDSDGAARAEYLAAASETFEEWRRLAQGIGGAHGMLDIDQRLGPWLEEHMAPRLGRYVPICDRFEREAGLLIRDAVRSDSSRAAVVALARFVADEMLECMNDLVASFEAELTDTAERTEGMVVSAAHEVVRSSERSDAIGALTDQLTQVNEKVRLIALNARIEAARVGEKGRTFGVVAMEVKGLSDEIAALTSRIRDELG